MNINYAEYIKSPDWYVLSARIKKRDGRCLRCGKNRRLHCHHGTYKRLGKERDDDLFTLCEWCHHALHELYGKEKKHWPDLLMFTLWFMRTKDGRRGIEIRQRERKMRARAEKKVMARMPAVKPGAFDELLHGLRKANPMPVKVASKAQPFVRRINEKQWKHFMAIERRREKRRLRALRRKK